MTFSTRFANLSTGLRLPYVLQGDPLGVPMLLLHGPTDSWRSFEAFLDSLPSSIYAFAVTQRGHGDADKPISNYRTEDFASDAIAFMDAVGLKAAVLVGHSGSTYTIQRIAIDHPDRCLGLIMIGAPYGFHNKPGKTKLLHAVANLTDPVDHKFVRDFVQSTVTQQIPEAFANTLISEACKVPAHVWQATLQSLFASPIPTKYGVITVPTLLIWGDKDQICLLSDQNALMTAIKTAKLQVYQGAGHSPHIEQPKQVAKNVVAFVLSLEPKSKFKTTKNG